MLISVVATCNSHKTGRERELHYCDLLDSEDIPTEGQIQ